MWVFGRTRAPQALGSWSALSWLSTTDEVQSPGLLVRRNSPTEVAAWAEMVVADEVADGGAYPPTSWWTEHRIEVPDRLDREEWAKRVGSLYERHYAHGVHVALAWLTGSVDDPALMVPIRDGDGEFILQATRDEYRSVLRKLSAPLPGTATPRPGRSLEHRR
ncbi:hypothetical protein [Pseudonocardia sp.]|uniref:hypothetical protein n=1 Tax=Pseudonocardia sp. TaxID=60912 RepID=UPI002607DB70|nr:hypothetical protein [Pseudonocardia sp.]